MQRKLVCILHDHFIDEVTGAYTGPVMTRSSQVVIGSALRVACLTDTRQSTLGSKLGSAVVPGTADKHLGTCVSQMRAVFLHQGRFRVVGLSSDRSLGNCDSALRILPAPAPHVLDDKEYENG